MPLEYDFSKTKLRKGLSFPLRRSLPDRALEDAGVSLIDTAFYTTRRRSAVLLAHYWGEGHKGWAGAGLTGIHLYAVPSNERKATEDALVAQGLPALVRWLRELEGAGNTRRGVDQHFGAEYVDGALTIKAT